ncbi:hypothetical protein [Sphingosinicella terrae]|uniref:hypothetical protein n=1 Tax=Sphingosinicella terrae TaxID=2172047 RepID=UPI002549B80D|nr:hypothetical protein [Sphingosinicella terrae]
MVGGRTCSAEAKAFSDIGPPKTTTDRALNLGAESPLPSSSRRKLRRSLIEAE